MLQLREHNCMWLGSRAGLPWGWGSCYGACHVECVLSSLHVVVTPTIHQPSTMSLITSTDLQNLQNLNVFLPWILFIETHFSGTLDTTAHCLHLPENCSHWCCYSRISDFWCWNAFYSSHPIHDPIAALVSAHHLMTSNVTQKLKSYSKENNIPIGWQCTSFLHFINHRPAQCHWVTVISGKG